MVGCQLDRYCKLQVFSNDDMKWVAYFFNLMFIDNSTDENLVSIFRLRQLCWQAQPLNPVFVIVVIAAFSTFYAMPAYKYLRRMLNLVEYWRISQNLAESCRILQNLAESCRISQNLAEPCRILLNLAESHQKSQNLTESCRILQNLAESRRISQNLAESRRISQNLTKSRRNS